MPKRNAPLSAGGARIRSHTATRRRHDLVGESMGQERAVVPEPAQDLAPVVPLRAGADLALRKRRFAPGLLEATLRRERVGMDRVVRAHHASGLRAREMLESALHD